MEHPDAISRPDSGSLSERRFWGLLALSLVLHVAFWSHEKLTRLLLPSARAPDFIKVSLHSDGVPSPKPHPASAPARTASPQKKIASASRVSPPQASPTLSADASTSGTPSGGDTAVTLLRVSYPRLSRLLGEEGDVSFDVQTDVSGRVSTFSRTSASGLSRLDNAAEAAMTASLEDPNFFLPPGTRRVRISFRLSAED